MGRTWRDTSANPDPSSVWKGLQNITGLWRTQGLQTSFTAGLNTHITGPPASQSTSTPPPTTPLFTPPSPTLLLSEAAPALQILEEEVSQMFRRQKVMKAPGPDGVSHSCLKVGGLCSQHGTALHPAPPRHPRNVRQDAVCGLQLGVQNHRTRYPPPEAHPAHGACLHLSVDHQLPDQQETAGEAVNHHVRHPDNQHWRPLRVLYSPHCSSLYTNDCSSGDPFLKLVKYADGTTLIGLIRDDDETAYRQEVERLVNWCSQNHLEPNPLKTVELTVDFRRDPSVLPPLTILSNAIPTTDTFKFLGSTISRDLKWTT
ncbi:uncharacterized protein ACBT44_005578 [Syngnathus typhle]